MSPGGRSPGGETEAGLPDKADGGSTGGKPRLASKKRRAAGARASAAAKAGTQQSASELGCGLTLADLTPAEVEVMRSIGKIKRQKQRASFERICNVLKQLKQEFAVFETNDSVAAQLRACLSRGLLQECYSDTGILSYKEMGPGVAIVAQIAGRKNAASLAATFNMDMSFVAEATEPEPCPPTRAAAASTTTTCLRERPARRSHKKKTESQPQSEAAAGDRPAEAAEAVKVCGLCRADGSHNNTLITCSACGLSGECGASHRSLAGTRASLARRVVQRLCTHASCGSRSRSRSRYRLPLPDRRPSPFLAASALLPSPSLVPPCRSRVLSALLGRAVREDQELV